MPAIQVHQNPAVQVHQCATNAFVALLGKFPMLVASTLNE